MFTPLKNNVRGRVKLNKLSKYNRAINPPEASLAGFREDVIRFIKTVPKGKVVSYGQVAAACGHPKAARQVGGILKALDPSEGKAPWWRVVNNQGVISIKGNWTATKEHQAELLRKEGIEVSKDFNLDIEKYRY